MGTHSLITFIDGDQAITTVYRQFDGYPSGRGKGLATFLASKRMVNGFSNDKSVTEANGMGCLAAQWIKFEKDRVGNVYIYPPDIEDNDCGAEFHYWVSGDGSAPLTVAVTADEPLFEGNVDEFVAWVEGYA